MRKFNNYKICKESFDDMREAGRFNPSLEITFRDNKGSHIHKLGAGYSDDIHVYRQYDETYVLAQNTRLGYLGLEVFNGPDQTGDIFLEQHQVEETIGRDDLEPFTIIRRLMPYL